MTSLTEKINNVIEWFKNLDDGTKKQIATFFLIVSAIGPVLLVLSKLFKVFSVFPKVLDILKVGFGGLSKVFSFLAAHQVIAGNTCYYCSVSFTYTTLTKMLEMQFKMPGSRLKHSLTI